MDIGIDSGVVRKKILAGVAFLRSQGSKFERIGEVIRRVKEGEVVDEVEVDEVEVDEEKRRKMEILERIRKRKEGKSDFVFVEGVLYHKDRVKEAKKKRKSVLGDLLIPASERPKKPEDQVKLKEETNSGRANLVKESIGLINQNLDGYMETPPELAVELFPYQKKCLAWMSGRKKNPGEDLPVGGILADGMGLGKTIQTIACILQNKPSYTRQNKATLIICPLSCVYQWQSEIQEKAPGVFNTVIHHGANRAKYAYELSSYDVVITTYSTLANEYGKANDPDSLINAKGCLHQIQWYRVILDEAHMIKNGNARQSTACYALESRSRWCLTGTPIQNSLEDLFSLFVFLRYTPYSDKEYWRKKFVPQLKTFTQIQSLLSPILIARTKELLGEGTQKHIKIRTDYFSPEEQEFYDKIHEKSKKKLEDLIDSGALHSSFTNIMVLLLRMRQACNHYYLITKGKKEKKTRVSEVGECLICEDILDNPVSSACMHNYCTECILNHYADRETSYLCCPKCFSPLTLGVEKEKIEKEEIELVEDHDNFALHSTKIRSLIGELQEAQRRDPGCKGIIFSQWTSMLDIVEMALDQYGYQYVRLDGSCSMTKRRKVLDTFKTSETANILLMSLKAGGLGLNLTEANCVYLLDPWWNPAVEEQAIDRVHRYGQQKEVYVVRFTIANSVESNMLEMQQKKKALATGAMGAQPTDMKLTINDLKALFK